MFKIKNSAQGFTLLELLVVVLIIGILAAIALPQYQMAVARSKYSTLKDITRNLGQSSQRHYMISGKRVSSIEDLDITYDLKQTYKDGSSFYLYFKDDSHCIIWVDRAACYKTLHGIEVAYYYFSNEPKKCLSFSIDPNDFGNKLCRQETGKQGQILEGRYTSYKY